MRFLELIKKNGCKLHVENAAICGVMHNLPTSGPVSERVEIKLTAHLLVLAQEIR